MAPTRTGLSDITTRATNKVVPLARRPISTRAHQKLGVLSENAQNIVSNVGKRKADASPVRNDKNVKRAALGNVTNAVLNAIDGDNKLTQRALKTIATKKTTVPLQSIKDENATQSLLNAVSKAARGTKVATRASTRSTDVVKSNTATITEATSGMQKVKISSGATRKSTKTTTAVNAKNKLDVVHEDGSDKENIKSYNVQKSRRNSRRLSVELSAIDNEKSLYLSALEDLSSSRLSFGERPKSSCSNASYSSAGTIATISEGSTDATVVEKPLSIPYGVDDFDLENWDDPGQVSEYVMDIFNYLKEREKVFAIQPYMERQPHLSTWMRTLLVDWMVEVQETFELNHETLYLAVKVVDLYLSKQTICKENLQLVGAAAMFIACKYDERIPPSIDDFLFICDGAYKQPEFIRMEMDAFRAIGYDLGIPLSYRFLRRYARCGKVTMPELTLARYILEFSLMSYDMITLSDSKVAAACLFMALRMSDKTGWNKQLQYYSGFKVDDFRDIVSLLNDPLHRKQFDANKTVRTKYAHKVFFEVSKIPLMTNEQLLDGSELIETL